MEEKTDSTARFDREVDPEIAARRNALFAKYITPYYKLIHWLVRRYSASPATVEENYYLVLTNLFRGIETYNPEADIRTWIHICSKRFIFETEKRRARVTEQRDNDLDVNDIVTEDFWGYGHTDKVSANAMNEYNYREYYSDDVLDALDSLNPIHRDALILQTAGYSLKEIAEIEYQKGRLDSRNIDTVKSRLFLARQTLMKKLNRNGTRKTN